MHRLSVTLASVLLAASASAQSSADAVAASIRATVESRRSTEMRWGRLDDVASDLRSVYGGGQPLWSTPDGRPTAAAVALIGEIRRTDARGLRPDDYDADWLGRWSSATPANASDRAAADVMLSTAAARIIRALNFGRVTPRVAHASLKFSRDSLDVAAAVLALARGTTRPAAALDGFEPPYLHYRLLRDALARYRKLATDGSLLPVGLGKTTLRPGDTLSALPRLRRLLVTLGDAPDTLRPPADSTQYDAALVSAVKHFQRRQGFDDDGIIGAATRARLERPFEGRLEQIEITLDRWRWLPHEFTVPPVVVNVPAFRLHAFRSASDREADLLSMDVAVGDAYDHRTPVFSGDMRYLVFSPYWDVPPSITRNEILPKARRDAGYLTRGHFEIVSNTGSVLAPTAIDLVASGKARIRQKPGSWNSLGGVKFIFPNANNIYLHDTPAQDAFSKARRDVSHGCIRLAEPARLAAWLLDGQSPAAPWDSSRIAAAMRRGTPQQVNLTRAVPVHIVYATAVAREDGRVFFYDDIYGHDRTFARLLGRAYAN